MLLFDYWRIVDWYVPGLQNVYLEKKKCLIIKCEKQFIS